MIIYNIILIQLIENNTLIDVIKITNTDLNNIIQKILKLSIEYDINKIDSVHVFVTHFKKSNILDYLDIFIKKIKKKNVINLNKLERILLEDNDIINISPLKYINSLVNQI